MTFKFHDALQLQAKYAEIQEEQMFIALYPLKLVSGKVGFC